MYLGVGVVPLPFREPDRLVLASLEIGGVRGARVDTLPWSYPKFRTFLETQRSFAGAGSESHQSTQAPGSRKRGASDARVHEETRTQAFAIRERSGGSRGGAGGGGGLGGGS